MEQILTEYYSDNARKLHRLVDRMLLKFGGISEKDRDDFYSLANEVFVDTMRKYNGEQPFDSFFAACLSNRMKTEMTRRNRYKRRADRMAVPIDMPLGDGDNQILADRLVSDTDIEEEVLGGKDERIERYLTSLSGVQRKIVELKMYQADTALIKKKLNLSDKQYEAHMRQVKQYEHIRLLYI